MHSTLLLGVYASLCLASCSSQLRSKQSEPKSSDSSASQCQGRAATASLVGSALKFEAGSAEYQLPAVEIASRTLSVRGIAYYPATTAGDKTPVAPGRFPLVVAVHGNHDNIRRAGVLDCSRTIADALLESGVEEIRSELGFDYIGTELSKSGIVFLSLYVNELNCQSGSLIAERTKLVYHHIKSLQEGPALSPELEALRQQIDFTKIVLMGHSRGGEAVAAARQFATGIKIRGIAAIAPTDLEKTTPKDIPFFVVLPAADGDVWQAAGARLFDRAGSGEGHSQWFKSQAYIYGANHNFYNTRWNETGTVAGIFKEGGDDGIENGDNRLSAGAQRGHLLAHLRAFISLVVDGQKTQKAVFRGSSAIAGQESVLTLWSYAESKSGQTLAVQAVAANGAELGAYSFDGKKDNAYSRSFYNETDGIVASFARTPASLDLAVEANLSTVDAIALRLGQVFQSSAEQIDQPLSLSFVDGAGRTAAVPVQSMPNLLAPYMRPDFAYISFGGRQTAPATKSMLGTAIVSSRCLLEVQPDFDLSSVKSIGLLAGDGPGGGLTIAVESWQLLK